MAIALSVGVGVVQIPTSARTFGSSAPSVRTTERRSDAALQQAVRQQLVAVAKPETHDANLLSERVKEEFFRTEIPYGSLIYREAMRNELPPELVAAVVKAESDFRPRLKSHKNALGLMQLMPRTGALMGARNLLDPADNVRAGTRYLRYLYGRYGKDHAKVIAAYNAGPGNVARFGGIPPFRETHNYLKRVAVNHAEYSRRLARRLVAKDLGVEVAERMQLPSRRIDRALRSVKLAALPPRIENAAMTEAPMMETSIVDLSQRVEETLAQPAAPAEPLDTVASTPLEPTPAAEMIPEMIPAATEVSEPGEVGTIQ